MKVTRRGFLIGAIGVCVAATPLGLYSAVYEPNDIEITRRSIRIAKLPSSLEGMTAVQISDLHLKGDGNTHARMVEMVHSLKPDAIFFTGDLVDSPSAVNDAVDVFRSWQPPLGTLAVPGNWDHQAEAVDLLSGRLKAAKVRLLVNESAQLASGLWIAGVDDPSSAFQDLGAAIADIPTGAPRILLAHSP